MYKYYLSVSNPEFEEQTVSLLSETKYTTEELEKILMECCTKAVEQKELYSGGERISRENMQKGSINHDEIFESGITFMVKYRGFTHSKKPDAFCCIDPYGHCRWMKNLENKVKDSAYLKL